MNKGTLKQKLTTGDLSLGSWITLGHPAIAEIMARAGFEWLAVDLEHSVITIREAEELIRIIDLCGVSPLVRLTWNDPNQIKRVMDAGAHGVIVPMVNSSEQAAAAVSAVRYPSAGKRGVGLARAQGYGSSFNDYLEWQESNAVVIVQIEHIDAVNNIDEILATDGVDGYIIGPYDLSGSMGMPGELTHPDVVKAMQQVKDAGKANNMPGGVHIIEPDTEQLSMRSQEGYKFIAYSLDIRMLDVASRQCIDTLKED